MDKYTWVHFKLQNFVFFNYSLYQFNFIISVFLFLTFLIFSIYTFITNKKRENGKIINLKLRRKIKYAQNKWNQEELREDKRRKPKIKFSEFLSAFRSHQSNTKSIEKLRSNRHPQEKHYGQRDMPYKRHHREIICS